MSLRIFVLALVTGCLLLQADAIYSNFGVDAGYATGTGLIVSNNSAAGASVAIAFTPTDNYDLTSIEFVASSLISGGPGVTLGIFADDGGQPAGSALESFSIDGLLGSFGGPVPVLTVTSSLQPFLQANTLYWIGMQGPVGGLAIWNLNSSLAAGISSNDGAGHWLASDAPQGVVRINGTVALAPVLPDPFILEAIILAPSAAHVSSEDQALTPEPRTWWLMAAGLFVTYKQRSRLTNQK